MLDAFPMSLYLSLELLKHGLSVLKETVKKCKDGLTAQLRKKEKISEQVMEDSTDEEISEAVQKMRDDRENMETNAGDDGADSAQDRKPTRKDALQALSILRRYLQDEHGTYARKLELRLAKFGRET
ncbi:hypothetical protein B0H13DRAFT_1899604 [Mycena leptocephala]|nr:hypothetical protein B0H13DRAFT_1899604 [Mycena leptocephala]